MSLLLLLLIHITAFAFNRECLFTAVDPSIKMKPYLIIFLLTVVVLCVNSTNKKLLVDYGTPSDVSIEATAVAIVKNADNSDGDMVSRVFAHIHDSTPVILMDLNNFSHSVTVYNVIVWVLELSVDWVRGSVIFTFSAGLKRSFFVHRVYMI